ncbi:MAG: class A beta-lactamase [Myxococcota bacterium]
MASSPPLSRRALLAALAALPLAGRAVAAPSAWTPVPALAALERTHGGRLGVCVLDTATSARSGHRPDERFALCSTFKALLAGHVLARVDRGEEQLDRAVPVVAADLVSHSPVVERHVGATISLRALCHATVTVSDNAAANLLLAALGGPAALTTFVRTLGDTVTRLDRTEPSLNVVDLRAGDERDTTTPAAMAGSLAALLVGGALRPDAVALLTTWLRESSTGLTRLRGGLPAAWLPGDKTGTGPDGETNDVAVGWPPGRGPVVVTAYYDRAGRDTTKNAAVLAEVGRIVG